MTAVKKEPNGKLARNIGIVAACIILLLPISLILWRHRLGKRVDSDLKRLRDSGLPVSGADLNAWRPVPPRAENGAIILKEGFALLRDFTVVTTNRPHFNNLFQTNYWSLENISNLKKFAETNRAALATIDEGLKLHRFAYVTDYSPGLATLLPHLAKIKEAAGVSSARAAVGIESNDERAFVEDVNRIERLAETLDAEPILISWLVRNAVMHIGIKTTERALTRKPLSTPALKELDAILARGAATNLLPNALIGERALALPIFKASASELNGYLEVARDDWSGQFELRFASALGLFDRDCRTYIAIMDHCITLAEKPAPQSLSLTNYLEDFHKTGIQRGVWLSTMLTSGIGKSTTKGANLQAAVNCARTALALEIFRNEKKRAAESLQELGADFAIPLDPFDGKPIRFGKLPNGFVVYSVGEDGTDDGGAEKDYSKSGLGKPSDLTFKVERVQP